MADLFAGLGMPETASVPAANAPLADRLRPSRLADVVGQEHLTAPEGAIGRMIAAGRLSSMILWGPPGVGKTTISRLIAREAGYEFMQLSAVTTGLADLRKAIAAAAALRNATGRPTAVFIDELHRFSRPVQDAMLPALEDGTFTLIGATTENPSFSLVSALLSRAKVFTLKRLSEDDLEQVIVRAEGHFERPLPLDPVARGALIGMADGDARYLLGLCDDLFAVGTDQPLSVQQLAEIVQVRAPLYDKGQEEHFNMLSSFHKSLRGSDVDAAMYWAARMLASGEDPAVIFRRLLCAASEDVGMADPQAMVQVLTAWQAFERAGLPEGRLFLAQAIAYVATAPKSNAAYLAFDKATALARKTGSLPPPKHILNAPTALMKELGYHEGYQYDHDRPDAFSGQEFYPDDIAAARPEPLYQPNERGFEREIRKRLAFWSARRESGR
ncbi:MULTISPECIES: replication-associated recombination protein A [unclassified Sphingomonas]|uniref:replication-associated recombination protein A n=1 Tax=unclassified Sphingomonas TaxID=196159 RepID=UPI001D0FA1A5|nr:MULTISPECIES: replication-associated recombination protein A [unclassified Sphingomonas]MCC2979039.1 replication-associated recombination protein A [Sphingomonas sp. IC4-52]MCD2315715.1 replication-associated recombination protein A [Sphingomonas sp. IC-11]